MRRSKKRLAALALSVVMAASTMTVPAFAEGQVSAGYRVDEKSVKFHWQEEGYADGEVTYTEVALDGSGQSYDCKAQGTILDHRDATCVDPEYTWYTITIDDLVFNSGDTKDLKTAFVGDPAKGHDWEYIEAEGYYDYKFPTCTEAGEGYFYRQCKVCKLREEQPILMEIEAMGHVYGENKIKYEVAVEWNTVLDDETGEPTLIDPLKDGVYNEITYHVCERELYDGTVCGHVEEVKKEQKVILAAKVYKWVVEKTENVNEDVTKLTGLEEKNVPAAEKICLKDCTKDGKYLVVAYALSSDGKEDVRVSERWVTVPAHHYNTVVNIEFTSADDAKQCYVEGGKFIKNNSCWKSITYYEVTHCSAPTCPNKKCDTTKYLCNNKDLTEVSRVERVAAPQGEHVINTTTKKIVNDMIDANGYADYDDLVVLSNQAGSAIKVSDNTATCTEDGTATVTYLCKVCQAEVEKVTVKTVKLGHKKSAPAEENPKAATCEEPGYYEAVITCERCGLELERRPVTTPRLAHSNEVSVTPAGVGTNDTKTDATAYIVLVGNKVVDNDAELYDEFTANGPFEAGNIVGGYTTIAKGPKEFSVRGEVYTNCTMCKNHEVKLDSSDTVAFKVLNVVRQKENGEAGSIMLSASYTKMNAGSANGTVITEVYTLPYFTSIEAYQGRLETAPLNGLNLDSDGVFRYYVDGKFDSSFNGIVEYNNERFFVANGVLCSYAQGLNTFDGETWYFLSDGRINTEYTGVASYDGAYFYIVDGKLDKNVSGLVTIDGAQFVFGAGQLQTGANGLWQDVADGTWYFCALGKVQEQFTGVAMYDNAFFVVNNGKLDVDYNGTIVYDGATFNVVAGQLYDQVA